MKLLPDTCCGVVSPPAYLAWLETVLPAQLACGSSCLLGPDHWDQPIGGSASAGCSRHLGMQPAQAVIRPKTLKPVHKHRGSHPADQTACGRVRAQQAPSMLLGDVQAAQFQAQRCFWVAQAHREAGAPQAAHSLLTRARQRAGEAITAHRECAQPDQAALHSLQQLQEQAGAWGCIAQVGSQVACTAWITALSC